MAVRCFLALSAALWLPYGIYCFLVPTSLAEAAGVVSQSATGSTELRAMYGGLQAAIGVLAGAAVVRPGLVRPALVALGFLAAGLATARALGVALDGGFSSYTAMGLGFEIATAAVATLLVTRTDVTAFSATQFRRSERSERAGEAPKAPSSLRSERSERAGEAPEAPSSSA